MDFDPTGTFLATGSADHNVRVWDIEKGFCTHNFKGHKGVVTCVKFQVRPNEWSLFSSCEDGSIMAWDLITKKFVKSLLLLLHYFIRLILLYCFISLLICIHTLIILFKFNKLINY
jgi:WD40 repeat protein